MNSLNTTRNYGEVLGELRKEFDFKSVKEHKMISYSVYSRFLEMIAYYTSKTIEDSINYINEAKRQRMKNLFPYFFNILPNRFLVEVKPKLDIIKPLKINIGEKIIGRSGLGVKENTEDVHCTNVLDTYILPFIISESYYDYSAGNIILKLTNKTPFIFDIDNFYLWVDYKKDLTRSIYIYDLIKNCCTGNLVIHYVNGEKKIFSINLSSDLIYKMHPNLNVKLLMNSPDFFLAFKVNIQNYIQSDQHIRDIELRLLSSSIIAKYDIKRIFHINYLPLLNMHKEFAQVVEYDSLKESYPLLHPVSDNFYPYFIRNIKLDTNELNKKITPEIFIDPSDDFSYKTLSPSSLNNIKHQHISISLPTRILKSNISILAEWTQLFEVDWNDIVFNFYNKQIGMFDINTISYGKFNDLDQFNNTENILSLLKLHNLSLLKIDDFKYITNALISSDSVFKNFSYELMGLETGKDNLCNYKLVFKKVNHMGQSLIRLMVVGLESFLNGNLGFDKKVKCTAVFKTLKK
ncbi:MAG: hypothetical protein GY756_00955 [bacterium]|nr:hypothetical protein [bacterium]